MASQGTAAQFADYLRTGFYEEVGQTPYFFDPTDGDPITYDLSGLDSRGQFLAQQAMAAWESVVDVTFERGGSGAELRFVDHEPGATTRVSYRTDGVITSAQINVSSEWVDRYGSSLDSYTYRTYLHEIGHTLGMGHPAHYGSHESHDDAIYSNDSWQMSVMSYLGQDENPNVSASRAVNVTPMEADILAVRAIYGASEKGVTAGKTVWGVNSNLDTPLGEMFRAMTQGDSDSFQGGEGFTFYLDDEGGTDRIDFRNDRHDQKIDLRGGAASNLMGETGNMLIAEDSVIEHYRAGTGDDRVGGNDASNRLWGNDGDDLLIGRSGHDRLAGQDGSDELRGGGGRDVLIGGRGNDLLKGHSGNDTLRGGGNDDVLKGGSGDDRLKGHSGADGLYGQNGADRLEGGGGDDVLKGGGEQDLLKGGSGNDRLYGQSQDDLLYGQKGHDRMLGGDGDDRLKGASGDDVLKGGRDDDKLYGQNGADVLHGGSGDDLLAGGNGDDILTGGDGIDRFVFTDGTDRITDHDSGVDRIQFDISQISGAQGMTDEDLAGLARETGGNVEFDFGSGNRLIVENQTFAGLSSDLEII